MKKNYAAKLGALALVLTMMSTCLMGGTLARYVTKVDGTAKATVAAWSFKANGENVNMAEINLGDTTHRKSYDSKTIVENVIAPGTEGSFDIELDGSGSDVGINYEVVVASKSGTLPGDLKFTVDDKDYILTTDIIKGTIEQGATMTKKVTVKWEWPFDDTTSAEKTAAKDTADTTLGESKDKDIILTITATGKQVELKTPATT